MQSPSKAQSQGSSITRIVMDEPSKFKLSIPDTSEQKERDKFIKKIERNVRSSYEYKNMISFFRSQLNINRCMFFPEIDLTANKGLSIEFHHYPFTLFDISNIILSKRLFNYESIDEFSLTEEIVKAHYEGLIGFVPLSKTAHDLAHSGQLFIPLNYVFGNYNKFLEVYQSSISYDLKECLQNLVNLTEKWDPNKEIPCFKINTSILEIKGLNQYINKNIEEFESQEEAI